MEIQPLKDKKIKVENPEKFVFVFEDVLSAVEWLKKEILELSDDRYLISMTYDEVIEKIDLAFEDVLGK